MRRVLFVVGTVGVLLMLVALLTGGFVLDAGPLHLTVRDWLRPAIVAAAAATFLFKWAGTAAVTELAALVWPFVERHAVAMAVVLAAATAAAGIAHGTYAASGADAAGYVGQADLMASGHFAVPVPLTRQVAWADAAVAFSPLGYRPGLTSGDVVPTYPPGLPLAMALAQRVSGREAVYLVIPLLGALTVLCTFALGRRLHSAAAGVAAAALIATSPILIFQVSQPMSDVAATAWWALAVMLASPGTSAGALLAGASAGLGFLTRPVLLPLLIPVALTLVWGRTLVRSRLLAALLAGFAPFAIGLAFLQQRLYGTPFGSGHGSFSYFFGWENVFPNIGLIGARFVRGETAALSLAGLAAVVLVLTRRSMTASPSPSPRVATGVGITSLAVVLVCYVPYAVFYDWAYLRFLLPAFPALFVGIGALVARACLRLPIAVRGLALLTAMTIACSLNVVEARHQGAFLVRRSEARYQITGQYLQSMLPEGAVVVAGQHSASAYHYSRRPLVRWDVMMTDLDKVVADLTALGYHPVLVLEEWEERDIRLRFPLSSLARLSWRPRADIGDHVRVRVYDPAERAAPGPLGRTDRIHAP